MKHRCPICRKPTDSVTDADFPFCNERCRMVDLGNWATEKYKVSEPMMDESEVEDTDTNQPGSRRNHHDDDEHDGGERNEE